MEENKSPLRPLVAAALSLRPGAPSRLGSLSAFRLAFGLVLVMISSTAVTAQEKPCQAQMTALYARASPDLSLMLDKLSIDKRASVLAWADCDVPHYNIGRVVEEAVRALDQATATADGTELFLSAAQSLKITRPTGDFARSSLVALISRSKAARKILEPRLQPPAGDLGWASIMADLNAETLSLQAWSALSQNGLVTVEPPPARDDLAAAMLLAASYLQYAKTDRTFVLKDLAANPVNVDAFGQLWLRAENALKVSAGTTLREHDVEIIKQTAQYLPAVKEVFKLAGRPAPNFSIGMIALRMTVKPVAAATPKPNPLTATVTPKPNPSTATVTPKPNPSTATVTPKPNPSTVTPKPNPVTAKPNPVTAKPNPVTAKPNPVTPKPNPATAKPNPVTAKPNPVTAKPEPATTTTSPEPARTTNNKPGQVDKKDDAAKDDAAKDAAKDDAAKDDAAKDAAKDDAAKDDAAQTNNELAWWDGTTGTVRLTLLAIGLLLPWILILVLWLMKRRSHPAYLKVANRSLAVSTFIVAGELIAILLIGYVVAEPSVFFQELALDNVFFALPLYAFVVILVVLTKMDKQGQLASRRVLKLWAKWGGPVLGILTIAYLVTKFVLDAGLTAPFMRIVDIIFAVVIGLSAIAFAVQLWRSGATSAPPVPVDSPAPSPPEHDEPAVTDSEDSQPAPAPVVESAPALAPLVETSVASTHEDPTDVESGEDDSEFEGMSDEDFAAAFAALDDDSDEGSAASGAGEDGDDDRAELYKLLGDD